jgi:hypothetical protein
MHSPIILRAVLYPQYIHLTPSLLRSRYQDVCLHLSEQLATADSDGPSLDYPMTWCADYTLHDSEALFPLAPVAD